MWGCPAAGPQAAADFGQLVRGLRVQAELSQKDLADRVGTTQSAIARMENGSAEPKIATLERLAEALNTELTLRVDGRVAQ